MPIFAISGFINGGVALIFAYFIYFKNRRGRINQIFSLMSLAIFFWGISYGFWQLSEERESALFWLRILSLSATFIPVLFLHWVITLLEISEKKKLLAFCYALTFIFAVFSAAPLYVKDVGPILNFPWWPQAGIFYTLYVLIGYCGFTVYGFYLLFKFHQKVPHPKKEQIKYVILGSFLGLAGGLTNFPLWYGIPYWPYGTFLVFLYPFILGYAVSRHKLMDIRVALTEFLVVLIGVILLSDVILSETVSQRLFRGGIFLVFCFFAYSLVKSVLNEIQRREELERLTKAKSEFISIASHQLRTPLTVIKGYASMILENTYGKISGKIKSPLENIAVSAERLLKLVNDLLNLSRLESGKLEMQFFETSLQDLIGEIISELKIKAEGKNLYIRFLKNGEFPSLSLDKEKIRQAIFNIIDNAIRYTDKGGIKIELAREGKEAIVIIADTGEGISENEISNLFGSFARGGAGNKFWAEGTGLGLYTAKKFVEMHEGRIWAESEGLGKGTTFYISLPIHPVK